MFNIPSFLGSKISYLLYQQIFDFEEFNNAMICLYLKKASLNIDMVSKIIESQVIINSLKHNIWGGINLIYY